MRNNSRVNSVEDFISSIKNKLRVLKDEDEICSIWFRGENNIKFSTPLMPKLYRAYNDPNSPYIYSYAKNLEENLKSDFAIRSVPYLQNNNIHQTKWNNYFLMQHYGLETRLLDWTESALNALFFAIQDLSENDCRVWILNPHKLNEFTTGKIHPENKGVPSLINPSPCDKDELFDPSKMFRLNELARIYLESDFENSKAKYNCTFYPLAIIPSILDERMNVQSSCFTIFGDIVNGLQKLNDQVDFLDSIIVNGSKKREIREELRWLGISNKSIYPDLQGLSRSISDKYNQDHKILETIKKQSQN